MDVAGVKVTYLHSPESTSCQNEYPSDNPEDRHAHLLILPNRLYFRRQHMKSLALPFTREDLKGYDFSGAIVRTDISKR